MKFSAITAPEGDFGANPNTKAIVLGELSQRCPLINVAEWYPVVGNTDSVPKKDHLVGAGENRAINAPYASATTSAVTDATATLRIFGDVVKTDVALDRRGEAVDVKSVADVKEVAASIGRHWMDELFNGDNTGQRVNGLKAQCGSTRKIVVQSNGLQLIDGNSDTAVKSHQLFIRRLEKLVSYVGGYGPNTCIVMDDDIQAMLKTISSTKFSTTTKLDYFGQELELTTFGRIPIIGAGYAKDYSTKVLPFSETVGSSSDCSSVYAIRWGERRDVSLAGNKGLQVYANGMDGQQKITTIEFDCGVLVQDEWALAKLEGIRL